MLGGTLTQILLRQPADLAFLDDFALYIQNRGIGNDGRHQPMPNMLWWCEASPVCTVQIAITHVLNNTYNLKQRRCLTFSMLTWFNSFSIVL